jgi:hypothetical protein
MTDDGQVGLWTCDVGVNGNGVNRNRVSLSSVGDGAGALQG